MGNPSFDLDLESGTSYHLSGNGSFITNCDNRLLLFLPEEIWLEQTKANQIRRNVKHCLTYRTRTGKALLTGLRPSVDPFWFKGNLLRFEDGKMVKVQLVVFISQDKRTIQIFNPPCRAKKTTGKEKSLPEAFKSSQMKFHPVTRQR